MNKTSTARTDHSASVADSAFGRARVFEQVRMARPTAIGMLVEGIEYYARHEDVFIQKVADLLDDQELRRLFDEWPGEECADWTARFDAARAIGIAIGLSLRPEVLDVKVGAR